MSRADWAVYDYVRAGIEARCRLARVDEEREQLKLHARRMTRWLMRQTTVLLERGFIIPDRIWSTKLIHRFRAVRSLLEMKGGLLCAEDRQSLSHLRGRIIEAIDPFNIPVTWPDQQAEPDINRMEEGHPESEYSEDDENPVDAIYEEDDGIDEAMARLEMQEVAAAAIDAVLAQGYVPEEEQDVLQVHEPDAMIIDQQDPADP
jgi:hypothetical protein